MCRFLKEEDEKLSLEDNIFLEEDNEAGYEAEEDEEQDAEEEEEEGDEGEEEEEEAKESTKRKILRLVAEVASKVKEIIGNLITTAGQVVVTILLGLTGEPRRAFRTFTVSHSNLSLCVGHSLSLQVSCCPL